MPRPSRSRASSISAASMDSNSSSLFSHASESTSATKFTIERPVHASAVRAQSIRLPTKLPPPPSGLTEVNLSTLILDADLKDVPIGYYLGKLKELGPQLLTAATRTTIKIPSVPTLSSYIECHAPTVPPSSSLVPPPPSHILAIKSSDSDRTLLLPVHGVVWAARSAGLSILSSHPSAQPPSPHLPREPPPTPSHLPVIELTLPSSLAVPLIQGWVYLTSPSLLLQSLLPKLPPPPNSLAPLLNPAEPPVFNAATLAAALSALPSKVLMERVHLVHGMWQDVVALEMADQGLWDTMGRAWAILVAALALGEKRRSARLSAESQAPSAQADSYEFSA